MSQGNVLITGVSTGIGYFAAQKFVREGYQVYGSVRRQADADRLVEDFGVNFHPLIFDVTDEGAIHATADLLMSTIGGEGLQLLVNNSGLAITGPVQCLSTDEFRQQFEVNFFGLIAVTNAFLPLLGARDKCPHAPGKIINISSVASSSGMPFMTPYGSSKAAVDALSEGLRRELMIYGIDVIVFNPGPIKTPIWDKIVEPNALVRQTVYGKSLMIFHKLSLKQAEGAMPVERFVEKLFKAFRKKKYKTFEVIMRKKFLRYTMARMLVSDRSLDKILYKVLKMKP
ncbi:SDR family NAD(P)-dependent oxidoreductase [Reichenbachiella agarivorans]|uniref:SDR family NAD(P)-dependent oxidoreductase n=1 Tax=Reichenbachiella agarivorans TaxID=2979464 RepID=A0ABY6CJE3_9BACT|nr:SDR family NAD(P)-dependent oxidoreductase [Reichenbachiella agarivorans]UXP30647.1 SDR family NAD(P)-dependent oxidoreductase [Reichenbachiella agarivorans]